MSPYSLDLNEVTERAVLQAIETAVVDYFNVNDCIVDLKTNQACVLFNPNRHKRWIQKYNGHTPYSTSGIPVLIPLERLPKKIIRSAQPLLEQLITENHTAETYFKFMSRRGRVVEGTVAESFLDHHKISLVGAVAILKRRDAIQSESYVTGKPFLFAINRVQFYQGRVGIFLSRRSRKIPEHLLTEQFPKYRFTCFRRIPGGKFFIKTTAPRYRWGRFYKKEIRKALAGDYLKFYN